MVRTRVIKGKLAFYDTLTGTTLTSIKSVGFVGYPDIVVSTVVKDGEIYVYIPFRDGNPLVKLDYAINNMDLIVNKVA
jgi:hypothetical protein